MKFSHSVSTLRLDSSSRDFEGFPSPICHSLYISSTSSFAVASRHSVKLLPVVVMLLLYSLRPILRTKAAFFYLLILTLYLASMASMSRRISLGFISFLRLISLNMSSMFIFEILSFGFSSSQISFQTSGNFPAGQSGSPLCYKMTLFNISVVCSVRINP